jgi:Mn-dependent DtxR family transcriptional regulator
MTTALAWLSPASPHFLRRAGVSHPESADKIGLPAGAHRALSGRQLSLQTKHDSAYCSLANQSEVRMPFKARNLVLTKSQAACLVALQHRKGSKAKIAILAKVDLLKTAAALRVLMRLGLARQDRTKAWHTTARAKTCRFETVPDRPRRNNGVLGPGARRLLEVLDRPMRGREIAEKLGVTYQRVHQLTIRLYSQGRVTFGNPENPLWIVMRTGNKTPFLSRDEERVLSAIPPEYATNATKIKLAARMSENKVQQTLERLIASRFVKACEGFQGNKLYRITAAGLKHPQRDQSVRRAQAPRLPVESDRIRKALSAILDSGALRIRDVTDVLGVPHQSINALMQYLKRKHLVKKTGQEFSAPYALTDEGRAALAEMIRRHAA